jgi:hypothetical protein
VTKLNFSAGRKLSCDFVPRSADEARRYADWVCKNFERGLVTITLPDGTVVTSGGEAVVGSVPTTPANELDQWVAKKHAH